MARAESWTVSAVVSDMYVAADAIFWSSGVVPLDRSGNFGGKALQRRSALDNRDEAIYASRMDAEASNAQRITSSTFLSVESLLESQNLIEFAHSL